MQKLIQWVHHQTVNLIILALLLVILLVSSGIQLSSIFQFFGDWFYSTLHYDSRAEKAALLPGIPEPEGDYASPASSERVLSYIQQFAPIAVEESRKFKIPASIILATALIKSQVGHSPACKSGNNHFSLPCTADWTQESLTIKDACYKKFRSNWFCFRDFSHFLRKQCIEPQRLSIPDWTQLLEKSAIGREGLGIEITRIIQQYELYHFD